MSSGEQSRRTFDSPLAVRAPGNELVEDLAFAIDDEHGQAHVGEVGDALVPDNRHELGMRMTLCEDADVLFRAIAVRDTESRQRHVQASTGPGLVCG